MSLKPIIAGAFYNSGGGGGGDMLKSVYDPAGINTQVAGLSVANIFTAAQTISSGVLVASAPALSITQTWNNGAVGFTALDVNVTNTASAANTSFLLNLRVGGTAVFDVRADGIPHFNLWESRSGSNQIYNSGGGLVATFVYNSANSYIAIAGTSSSFPALKRSGAGLQARLADDSAYTTFAASGYLAGAVAGVTAGPFTTVSSIQVVGGIVTVLTGT